MYSDQTGLDGNAVRGVYGVGEGAETDSIVYAVGRAVGDAGVTYATGLVDENEVSNIYDNYSHDGNDGGGGDDGGNAGGSGNGKGPNQSVYIPTDANGNPVPLPKQPQRSGTDIPLPDPNANGAPHTTLGGREGSNGDVYRQSATFPGGSWPSVNGEDVPWSQIDWTDHGRPDAHSNPHQHDYTYDWSNSTWQRGPAGPVR